MDIMNQFRHIKNLKHVSRITLFLTFVLLFWLGAFFRPNLAKADEDKISVKEINYQKSTITLKVNDGDTEIYFSDSQKKTWDVIEGNINNNTITMDISWISVTSNYTINFKGNHSTGITTVVIPKQATSFTATYKKDKGTVAFKNVGIRSIQWKKKNCSTWSTVSEDTISRELSYLNANGASVIFRLAPINGTSNSDVGCRASKEIILTIPKKASAPSIVINGSRFSIAVKKGMAYRTKESDGTTSEWTTVSTSTNLLLQNIATKAMYTSSSTSQSKVTLQFRTNASSSSQISNITTIVVPIQEGPPDEDKYGISLNYTSASTCKIKVKAASTTTPFEYTIVKEDDELNYMTASWTAITSSTAITLTSTTAPAGCHIYLRKKSVEATDDVDFSLASVNLDLTGGSGVTYPDAIGISTKTTLVTTAGVCRTDNTSSYLTFTLYSPTETTVSSVDFYDTYGSEKGTVTIKSSVASNSSSTGTTDKYIVTTKITSTVNINSVTEEKLYAKLTMANTDTIMSTDTAGVILYLYPKTVVNNPTDDDAYTNSFNRIYMSTEDNDDTSFKFQLDLGTDKVIDKTAIGSYTSESTAISSITFNDDTLTKDTDYSIVYGSYVNEDGDTIRTATVTMNVSKFEKAAVATTSTSILDTAEPLEIILNNGEVLDNDIKIKLIRTATINSTPIAWSIMEGSLKETTTSTKTDTDGNKTSVTEEVITYTISLTLCNSTYGVGISDVTWGGTSILGSSTVSGGKATIYLSNAKINKLSTTSTTTNNLVITLSNGYVINTGCKLTITNAN